MQLAKVMNPLFSVVIPLYNKADTIGRAINSVAAQTFRDYELIVVNDGSTDCSLDVVSEISKDIPLRIVDQANGGVSSARNAGAAVAAGRFIALLDGDDVWFPSHLERMSQMISRHPEVKFFGGGYEREAGKYIYYTIPWPSARVMDAFSAFRYGQLVNSSTVVVEREIWDAVGGFDCRYSFYEDYEFFFRLAEHTKICITGLASACYKEDAVSQATKEKREESAAKFPHIALIEARLNARTASKDMLEYVRTFWLLRVTCRKIVKGTDTPDPFEAWFPLVTHSVRPPSSRLFFRLYLLYFKLRVHLKIWRRKRRGHEYC